jgi:dihydroanticapsin dehydrogenase
MERFRGRTALVVGGASGIGRAVARRLAEEGARVAVADLNREGAAGLAAELDGLVFGVDVTDEAGVAETLARAHEELGGLQAVFSSAGLLSAGEIAATDLATWNRCLGVNLTGAFLVAKYAFPILRDGGGGAILLTSSTAGLVGSPGQSAYCAAKFGIVGLTKALAAETAKDGIRVNCLCPGWVNTAFNDPVWEFLGGRGGAELELLATVPLRRQASPEEIAAAAAFLLSDDASYVTGAEFVIDGGLLAVR